MYYVLRLNRNISHLVCTCILLHCVVRASLYYIQICTEYSLVPRPCALVTCSTKFCVNFVLQATNPQGLGMELHWMQTCTECRRVLNADVYIYLVVLPRTIEQPWICSKWQLTRGLLRDSITSGTCSWVSNCLCSGDMVVTHVHQLVSFSYSHTPLLISVRSDERWSVRVWEQSVRKWFSCLPAKWFLFTL